MVPTQSGEYLVLTVALFAIAVVFRILYRLWRRPRARRHRYHIRQARRVIDRIESIPNPAQRMAYLRKIDPLTFEELLLEAAKRRGYRIHRNKRYSGDGGVDGRIESNGRVFLIQAKRYSGHVNRQDVADFRKLVEQSGCYGMFCHTGRTGAATREVGKTDRVTILSGESLLRFIDTA